MAAAQTTVHTTTTTTTTGAHHPGVILHDEWAYSPRVDGFRRKFHMKNPLVRNLLSEFYGTFLLVFIGDAICAQYILTRQTVNTWIQINLGWGLAIVFAVYATFKTSGGHLNPAISFGLFTLGKLPAMWLGLYIVAQMIGAFFGALGVYAVYFDLFNHFDGGYRMVTGVNASAGVFTSFPAPHVSLCGAFIDQVVGTAILMTFVTAFVDKRHQTPEHMWPLLFGFVVMMIGMAFGCNLGYPINPARDFGPRLATLLLGYGGEVFSAYNYYFWVPILAPFLGAALGAWLYMAFVGFHIAMPTDVKEYVKIREERISERIPLKEGEELHQ